MGNIGGFLCNFISRHSRKKVAAAISGKMQSADMKKLILLNFPYIIAFYMVEKAAWLYRHCNGDSVVDRLMVLFMNFGLAYKSVLPSFHPFDLMVGLVGAAVLKAVIYFKGKNAKKYRQGEEYGSARWGNQKDIEPFIDPVFENNVILTQTERLMMSGRPKHPKYARNKNVIVIGGRAGSFLGEYQAGGLIVVLGLHTDGKPVVGNFPCTGMHGGKMFIRGDVSDVVFPDRVNPVPATDEDMAEIEPYLREWCRNFGKDPEQILAGAFTVVTPDSRNPYKQMYVAN